VRRDLEGVRIILVDDHELYRAGLRTILSGRGATVAGEAVTGEAGVDLALQHAPCLVLMDLRLPGMDGIAATRAIADKRDDVRVLALSVSDEPDDVVGAIVAGACGYLVKGGSLDEIVGAVATAARGEAAVSPSAAAALVDRLRDRGRDDTQPADAFDLTAREIDVLRLIADGRDNAQIGVELSISPKTVKNHISNIFTKLGIENRVQAAVYAVRAGFL
jgi:DNA-binding NarL/FixJ family response regulator